MKDCSFVRAGKWWIATSLCKVLVVVTSRNNATSPQAEDAEDAASRIRHKPKTPQAEDAAHKERNVKVLMPFAIMATRRSCVMAKVVEGCCFVRCVLASGGILQLLDRRRSGVQNVCVKFGTGTIGRVEALCSAIFSKTSDD